MIKNLINLLYELFRLFSYNLRQEKEFLCFGSGLGRTRNILGPQLRQIVEKYQDRGIQRALRRFTEDWRLSSAAEFGSERCAKKNYLKIYPF